MKLGLLCPGQGDQSPTMFGLLTGCAAAEPALSLFSQATGCDPLALSAEEMQVNAVAQPLVCAYQLAVWAALRDLLPAPTALAGYSVGELAAYGCADALEPQAVIALARRRAERMDGAHAEGGAMLALRGLDRIAVDALCARHGVEIAIVNDVDRFVLGGDCAAIAACEVEALQRGAKVTPLAIHIPSHTSLMRPAVEKFHMDLQEVQWRRPIAPVLAGLDGSPVFAPEKASSALSQQLARPIDWAACLEGLRERGCAVLLELGPGAGLARMARDRMPEVSARSTAEFHTLKGVADWIARQDEL